ncbi:MAG: hypothetical protein IT285_00070 [Bdellovibrionales bacterium]|nr:hypothetical protein [Bdellovibrionales bacterium]
MIHSRSLVRVLTVGFLLFATGGRAGAVEGRAPVIFAHGVGVPAALYERFVPLRRVFAELGYRVHVARTPAGGTLEKRAAVLAAEVDRLVPEGPYHLIGHSMGGLDARLAIHRSGLASRCLSLTTLATPHRGSPLADLALKAVNEGNLGEFPGLEEVLALVGGEPEVLLNLTPGYLSGVFNPEVADDPRVRYFSIGFYVPSPVIAYAAAPPLWLMNDLLARMGHPLNDGPVPLASARWGEDLDTLPGDHYSETAPVPFGGRRIDAAVFARVLRNLDERF